MKIRIYGGPGSGKSTLAQQLSKKLQLPHLDLDDVKWRSTKDYSDARSPEEKAIYFKKWYDSHDEWILEGGSVNSWNWIALQEADHIIILKQNYLKENYRILTRNLQGTMYSGRKQNCKRGLQMFWWSYTFRFQRLPRTLHKLQKQNIPYHLCRNQKEIDSVCKYFLKK